MYPSSWQRLAQRSRSPRRLAADSRRRRWAKRSLLLRLSATSGRDSDSGALVGARADERQADIGLRATAFAGRVMTTFALAGFVIETARGEDAWPFALLCVVGAISFISGSVFYRRP